MFFIILILILIVLFILLKHFKKKTANLVVDKPVKKEFIVKLNKHNKNTNLIDTVNDDILSIDEIEKAISDVNDDDFDFGLRKKN